MPSPPAALAPIIKPYQPPPFGYTPPTAAPPPKASPFGPFTGTAPTAAPVNPFSGRAPTATTTGAFSAPDPNQVASSPYFQFRFGQGQKAIERGAAARGTLLTGGLQTKLAEFGQGLASEEADKNYQRALATYNTNRETDSANYGRAADTYRGDLAGYTTNRDTAGYNADQDQAAYRAQMAGYGVNRDTHAQNVAQDRAAFQDALSAGAHGLQAATAVYDRNAAAGRTAYEDAAGIAERDTATLNANNAASYRAQMADYERMQREQDEQYRRNLASSQSFNAFAQQPGGLAAPVGTVMPRRRQPGAWR